MSAARPRRGPGHRGRSTAAPPLAWWLLAIAVVVGLLIYVRSPIDLLPDRIGAIGLLDDLAAVLIAIWWLRRRSTPSGTAGPRPRGSRRATSGDDPGAARPRWDPHAVLGVARDEAPEGITRAYREQMKLYHPDRVAELGEELRALAHEKSLEIQRAYEEIGPRRR